MRSARSLALLILSEERGPAVRVVDSLARAVNNPVLPLMRLRLELDRTLRTRPFVSRSFRGALSREAYRDLVAQLAALAEPSGDEGLARAALSELGAAPHPDPCIAAVLFKGAIVAAGMSAAVAGPPILAAIGTSWLSTAAQGSGSARRGGFLEELYSRGKSSLERLRSELPGEAEQAYALAELTRGAMLGVATYLDEAWPPPVVHIELSPP
jgi:hypothetical protein